MTAHDIRGRPLCPPSTVRTESERIKVTSSIYAPPTQLLLLQMRGHSQMRAVRGPRPRSGKCGVMYHTYSYHAGVEWRSFA